MDVVLLLVLIVNGVFARPGGLPFGSSVLLEKLVCRVVLGRFLQLLDRLRPLRLLLFELRRQRVYSVVVVRGDCRPRGIDAIIISVSVSSRPLR